MHIFQSAHTELKLSWQHTSAGALELSKETGSVGKEKMVEDLRGGKCQDKERGERQCTAGESGGGEDRGSEGGVKKDKGRRGVFHRSCIVNEKFFTVWILFHCRPGVRGAVMERLINR